MKPFTLYIDESGQFKAKEDGDVGLRLVVGLLVAGDEQTQLEWLADPMTAALGWWPLPCHASDIANSYRLGFALKQAKIGSVPRFLRPLHSAVRKTPHYCWRTEKCDGKTIQRALELESKRLLRGLRGVLDSFLNHHSPATVIMAMEHDTRPRTSRYPAMRDAMIAAALLSLVNHGPAALRVVAESGALGGEQLPDPKDLSRPLSQAIERGLLSGFLPNTEAEHFYRSVGKGHDVVALSDLLAHQHGPGARQSLPLRSNQAMSTSLRHFTRLIPTDHVLITDGLHVGPLIRRVLEGSVTSARATEELRAYQRSLPEGTLRAAVDSGLEVLGSLS